MPVYNSLSGQNQAFGFFDQAISSLLSQTVTEFELIILDNQSTDGTFEYCEKIARQDTRIKVFRDDTRRSPEEAIRKLSELSDSDYCAIVNDDDKWDSRYFETLLTILESNHTISLAYTPVVNGLDASMSNQTLSTVLLHHVKPIFITISNIEILSQYHLGYSVAIVLLKVTHQECLTRTE